MPICIYCLEDKPLSEFSRDHVIPESFGTFKNNFTLTQEVCAKCNQYFGDKLELFLGRDTYEGMTRFILGVKAPEEFESFNRRRISFKLLEEGVWKNAHMKLGYDQELKQVVVTFVPQVGFKKDSKEEWGFFEFDNIPMKEDLKRKGFICEGKRCLKILFQEESQHENFLNILKEKGIILKIDEEERIPVEYRGKRVDVEIKSTIDAIIKRGIAKIAFNYLAYSIDHSFALNDNFNQIRDFIRYGRSGSNHVFFQKRPILFNEIRFGIRETQGHMITVEWDRANVQILSQITLFNTIIYKVILCRRYDGIIREIATGHHFDIISNEITSMPKLPRNFIVL